MNFGLTYRDCHWKCCLALWGVVTFCGHELFAAHPLKSADSTTVLRLQIFLDNHHFGSGELDGQFGTFTRRALEFYNLQNGFTRDEWKSAVRQSEKEVPIILATHRVSPTDLQQIGPVPASLSDQEKEKRLPYATVIEHLAERYHSSKRFLRRLNPDLDLNRVRVNDSVIVPNVKHVFRIDQLAQSQRFGREPYQSSCYALIDTRSKFASFYQGTKILAAFPITHGNGSFVPRGRWRLASMMTAPTFRWDERMLKEGQRSDQFHVLPPGPNNPVGILWAGINKKGIGLHGTNHPETIGRAHSAGCIRFANWDAVRLPDFIRPGSEVIIK